MRAQALLRHRNPRGELADVIDRALDALLAKLEKEKFGKTDRPRKAKARDADAEARSVPREVQRAVHARDGEQCTFVSDDGRRCTERGFIELDHRTPVALGGRATVEGLRVLCRPHNQYEAERLLGADFVREKRASGGAAQRGPSKRRRAKTDEWSTRGQAAMREVKDATWRMPWGSIARSRSPCGAWVSARVRPAGR